ncbi:MAG: hotdog fold thioesterase [Gemmatimonadetes bacterium]|nr:hotdog fold thioesterase [Gemmatimonadota bacterium]
MSQLDHATFDAHRDAILAVVRADPFAQSLGIALTRFEAGVAEATLTVQPHMRNAHGGLHGAVLYTLADFVFSVGCNAYGRIAVGLSTTIQFLATASVGDVLTARATELKRGQRAGFYRIEVWHGETLLATMDAVAHRTDRAFVSLTAAGSEGAS